MQFLIADTFNESLARLAGDEQKVAKTTAFDLQMNPANPGMQFHKLERAKDKNFWSVRVSRDIRLIVHKTASSLLLCYVDHHDKAYQWAERRKLETHPKTGAAQLVEVRETVREIEVPQYVQPEQVAPAKPALFAETPEDELLQYGVPTEWLDDVRQADEDSILELADHLPDEAAEALLELATGGKPELATTSLGATDPFDHPDAQRRFRIMHSSDELAQALEYPWDKWTVFLHPAQRDFVARTFNGPARVSGSAGTGKTIVALHRAVHLARAHEDARVLLTTFNESLANALKTKVQRLVTREPRLAERIEVAAIESVAQRLSGPSGKAPKIASDEQLTEVIEQAATSTGETGFSTRFLVAEWSDVVDAWQLHSWDDYRDVKRLGRKTRLPESQRRQLWSIFSEVRKELERRELNSMAGLFEDVTSQIEGRRNPPYDYVVVDEAQDVTVPQLRFLAALGADRPDAIFFAGDLGQRIFQTPFSWKALGVDVRGRSRTLKINYRTSHQIRAQADRLLDPSLSDLDGNTENRKGTVSVFNGPPPLVSVFDDYDSETEGVSQWLSDQCRDQGDTHEIGVIVRSDDELERAIAAVQRINADYQILDAKLIATPGTVSICTMHLAKGLEFRAVAVMACDDEVIPLQARIESIGDDADLEEVYNTERHLLYVACTRARDALFVSATDPPSEFLDDLEN
ncbi:3'-5' exonuclease [Salinisphaera sp. P385]|uniref:DNA 3'-5' helicase n=1 Tax=Spectribacter acetivorans TaxID=3075603 RepID=A0ABU3BBR1_9GAMM|nr:3'-5' exonuclease [Salinisphaera sp. P385]MDT0619894.1 3'-5' exonuclease [Salinisphaera sp. P385]